jgi:hypothetical protein
MRKDRDCLVVVTEVAEVNPRLRWWKGFGKGES